MRTGSGGQVFVPRGDIAAGELISWAAGRVARHKRIHAVEFVDQIPKLPSGKILRRLLDAGSRH